MSLPDTLLALLIGSILLPQIVLLHLSHLRFFTYTQAVLMNQLNHRQYNLADIDLNNCDIVGQQNKIQINHCTVKHKTNSSLTHYILRVD